MKCSASDTVKHCEYREFEKSKIILNCANDRSYGTKDCEDLPFYHSSDLSFRNCNISDITQEMLQNVTWKGLFRSIDVSNIGLEGLSSAIIGKIIITKELIAHHNRLKDLPRDAFAYKYLESLDLGFNQFAEITSIGQSGFDDLKTLILAHNNITTITDRSFDNLPELETLDLSFNNLQTLNLEPFEKLLNLRNLRLANTNLSHIDFESISALMNLISLDISGNHIKTINIGLHSAAFFHLEKLNLSSNGMMELNGLTTTILPRLTYLDLRGNQFNCTHLKEVFNLIDSHRLKLSTDRISEIKSNRAYRGLTCKPPLFDEKAKIVRNGADGQWKKPDATRDQYDDLNSLHQVQEKLNHKFNVLIIVLITMFIVAIVGIILYMRHESLISRQYRVWSGELHNNNRRTSNNIDETILIL